MLAQRGGLIGWLPVCLGTGIGAYFALRVEPGPAVWAGLVAGMALMILLSRSVDVAWRPLCLGLALVCGGVLLARIETQRMVQPVLGFRYYGPIEGRVVDIDRSASDAVRLTLDRVRLDRMSPDRTPRRVRVALHGDDASDALWRPGEVLMMTGHLSPPAGPAEPGGFDFRRYAFFEGLGAVGYTRTPVLRLSVAEGGASLWVFTQRMQLSHAIQAQIPGETGAFAAAVITGDRSGMGQDSLRDLRASNVAHLLAISGLHMGLLTGVVFAVIRTGLSLWPALALRIAVKKVAAVVALLAGAGYLLLSGGNVATERAYIMVAVMLVAVLLDRRALTLRAVAMAATIVLILHPDALTGPGFQMSFAATTALVVVFRLMRGVPLGPRWLRPVVSVLLSSAVAGAATAPFAAAHFNQISHYGLIANLLSVPLMGVLVMPAAVLAACLAPVGLAGVGFWLMGLGLRWILFVAQTIAGFDGALSHVKSPGGAVLPLMTLGLLWLILWQGRARVAGLAGIAAALAIWVQTPRPQILIADSGGLIGVLGPQGRVLSSEKGDGFVAGIWLENDGAPVAQDIAATRAGLTREGRQVRATLGAWRILHLRGKAALAQAEGCAGADVVISNQVDPAISRPDRSPVADGFMPRPVLAGRIIPSGQDAVTVPDCMVFDLTRLRQTGALALDLDGKGDLVVTSATALVGQRPWTASREKRREKEAGQDIWRQGRLLRLASARPMPDQ
ncbi:ComEC/Rec2 family competence protein [Loktanella sp. M215]|uniref:ComEC/Rec2 family competence protein n=1 Tax=Loktanella sp. M215 TaxID=2675431 RepID=UPI001F1DD4D4|nr:ComEC/Rec2 family competence protein [Loktanella sp. M215]